MSDAETWNHVPPKHPDPPRPELLETCWRMRGISGKVLSCGIYRLAAPGVEVRVGYSEDDVLNTKLVADMDAARAHAEDLKRLVVAKGGFEDVPCEH